MKNIAFFSILVIISFTVFGQEIKDKNFIFFISPQMGFVYGQTLELVYQDNRNDSEFLSRLSWDMKPVFYGGADIGFEMTNKKNTLGGFSIISFKAGIPGDSGYLQNRDWQSSSHGNWTDFSKHTNKTREFFIGDIEAGFIFPSDFFNLNMFLTFSWMRFAFTGRDGYGEYPESAYYKFVDFSGQKVHTYKQDWFLYAMGISISANALAPFKLDFSVRISPFTYCIAYDEHLSVYFPPAPNFPSGAYSNKRTYKDYTRYGLYLEPGVTVSYSINKFDLCLNFSSRHIGKTRGVTYINQSPLPDTRNESGAGLSLLDIGLLVCYRF